MNGLTLPDVIAETEETVTLRREDWQKLLEDRQDIEAAARFEALVREIGISDVKRLSYTDAETTQILDGVSPIAIWRRRKGVTQRALAKATGLSASYLAEIEAGKKPGSVTALAALAAFFAVPITHLHD